LCSKDSGNGGAQSTLYESPAIVFMQSLQMTFTLTVSTLLISLQSWVEKWLARVGDQTHNVRSWFSQVPMTFSHGFLFSKILNIESYQRELKWIMRIEGVLGFCVRQ